MAYQCRQLVLVLTGSPRSSRMDDFVRTIFSSYGRISRVAVLPQSGGSSVAFVDYEKTRDAAEAHQKLHKTSFDGVDISITYRKPSKTLFFRVPKNISEDEAKNILSTELSRFANITDLFITRNHDIFVTLKTEKEAVNVVVNLQEKIFGNWRLEIDFARVSKSLGSSLLNQFYYI